MRTCMVILVFLMSMFCSGTDQVTLPLETWHELIEQIKALENGEKKIKESAENPVAEIAEQYVAIQVEGSVARINHQFHVEVRGKPTPTIQLPITGFAQHIGIKPSGEGSVQYKDGFLVFAAPEPGRYLVTVEASASLGDDPVQNLKISAIKAPVSSITLDMPLKLQWQLQQAALVDEKENEGRRWAELAPRKNTALELVLAPKTEEKKDLLAAASVVTLIRARNDGFSRHDIILFEVDRGHIRHFTLDTPPQMIVEQALTDEGPVTPVLNKGKMKLARKKRLDSSGYAIISTGLEAQPEMLLQPITPDIPVRARYLAFSSVVPAEMRPLDESKWSRVDHDDLPNRLKVAASSLNLSSVWKLNDPNTPQRIALYTYARARQLETVVEKRTSTTLWSVDGRLVHRDRFLLERAQSDLIIELEPDMEVWSALVDDMPVRPMVRGTQVRIPLSFRELDKVNVELITLSKRARPAPRTVASIALPQLIVPVINHQWQLILPGDRKYRYLQGELQSTNETGMRIQERPSQNSLDAREAYMDFSSFNDLFLSGNYLLARVFCGKDVLPGTTLTLTGPNYKRTLVAGPTGQAWFPDLDPGSYEIVATFPGFQNLVLSVNVKDGAGQEVNLKMEPLVFQEEMVVTAEAPNVEATNLGSARFLDDPDNTDFRQLRSKKVGAIDNLSKIDGASFGMKPLPVELPEEGKILYMVGVLPPEGVSVQLQIR